MLMKLMKKLIVLKSKKIFSKGHYSKYKSISGSKSVLVNNAA